ncbi:HK97 gp10 family phage protein [Lysinibacter sp. HNR]|uniref:HK97 gp10 family phage protein n=1 Tax=Lysinibacter sp. HNR TaxID=3031408 RepID=UPI00243531B0|nr:HK97 gp10 family phage protein [Lysinibacter sp. HNR]WGD38477.1 HK97 gp10 family phage protein [Lysinibacter sp. HNR]
MARSGDVNFRPNKQWFDTALRSPKVEKLVKEAGESSLAEAKANAPVDTGEYKDKIAIEYHEAKYRRVLRVVGRDEKTLLIEAKTGNLARSLRAAKK